VGVVVVLDQLEVGAEFGLAEGADERFSQRQLLRFQGFRFSTREERRVKRVFAIVMLQ